MAEGFALSRDSCHPVSLRRLAWEVNGGHEGYTPLEGQEVPAAAKILRWELNSGS
jgi:hypothetical protein